MDRKRKYRRPAWERNANRTSFSANVRLGWPSNCRPSIVGDSLRFQFGNPTIGVIASGAVVRALCSGLFTQSRTWTPAGVATGKTYTMPGKFGVP
ncbi:hypothetical protein [Burkholderia cepacia]|uniref:hypothetical protein n=1 Tax=Burkholderia cepacia TaxID=292 RepID=UPI0012DA5B95|nr:hypothetical protein [Burkholderia cepacia]